ncbi:hypothetical protein VSWAT3_25804 [Vibrionales bacterium SWAT-3]|nr:hypothetical protein VSWAT3_25804 [Vibrionales bacterium SWAT-3]
MTDTALVGGICVDIRKSMSRFADAYKGLKQEVTGLIFSQGGLEVFLYCWVLWPW